MTPNPCLSKEDTNDDDYFYEIPAHVIHIDERNWETEKNITVAYLEKVQIIAWTNVI